MENKKFQLKSTFKPTGDQPQAIKKLVDGAKEIVIATDFDVEGEVIGYNVMRFIAHQKDASRMKFSSLTPKELQDSFDNRQPHIE